jgi:antitoxin VapB
MNNATTTAQAAAGVPVPSTRLFGFVGFESVTLADANRCLEAWGHRMGALNRGNQGAVCHALIHEGLAVAVTTASNLIAPVVGGGCAWMTRENTVELSRLCAARGGLCRVALRLWREFVFPTMGYEFAVSYQDADLHNGNTYRFDGWERVGRARSGTDTRSGRPGRDKWVWAWPGKPNVQDMPRRQTTNTGGTSE